MTKITKIDSSDRKGQKRKIEKEKKKSKKKTTTDNESGELLSSSESESNLENASERESEQEEKQKSKRKKKNDAEEGEIDSDLPIESTKQALNETNTKQLRKQIEIVRKEFESQQHKFNKIKRAYLKAEKENNKTNMKKCVKYLNIYDVKVEKLKKNLKALQLKLVKPDEKVLKKPTSNETKQIEQIKQSALNKLEQQATITDTAKSSVIKLPYPVLNDKRDMHTILGTLESKKQELDKRKEANRKNLDMLKYLVSSSTGGGIAEKQQRVEKLKQLEQSYEAQREKIEKQIEYVRLSLDLEAIRRESFIGNFSNMREKSIAIDQMAAKLNELYKYMKTENKIHLKKCQMSEASSSSTMQVQQTPNAPLQPIEKLKTMYDIVNNSLAALLAHTAASAHVAAAVAITNQYYSNYYKQKTADKKEGDVDSNIQRKPIVPLKTEIEKASSTFALYKTKISSFFLNTNKLKKEKKAEDGLGVLINNYKEDDDLQIIENETKKKEEDEEDVDEEDESDLEIVTTSELKEKSFKGNYLLPSLKASYFPLKASLYVGSSSQNLKSISSLIAVEKTKCALTFLGTSSAITNRIGVQKRSKLSDILFKNNSNSSCINKE